MYNDLSVLSSSTLKAQMNSDIITGTLNKLNSGEYYSPHKSAQSSLYDFQKDVLSSYYTEKGLGAIVYSRA